MPSCEDQVGVSLVAAIENSSKWELISYHPPSGKSYFNDHFPFPIIDSLGRKIGRGRYHFDIIAVSANVLLFVELKCKSSESKDDIEKLAQFSSTYTLDRIKRLIKSRLTNLSPEILLAPTELVFAIGAMHSDATVPEGYGLVTTTPAGGVRWNQIPSVSLQAQRELGDFET